MHKILLPTVGLLSQKNRHPLVWLYTALMFLSLHWSLVLYINSSFLGQFMTSSRISLLYAVGALIMLLCFFHSSHVLRSIGNYKFTLILIAFEFCALIGMSLASTATTAAFYFLLHFVTVPLLLFNIDVFIEQELGEQEKITGRMRGLYLSVLSLGAATSQLLAGTIINQEHVSFAFAYLVSTLFFLPFFLIIFFGFKKTKDANYTILSLRNMFMVWHTNNDTKYVVIISFFLQLFFTWMVIYTPIYLSQIVGFSWTEIGLILFVGLSAYALLELPVGIIADKFIGEKEMMAFGFVLVAITTSWFAFLTHAPLGVWMVVMFFTRVGASLVEATCESYFFKQTESIDTHKISLFRMTNPLALIAGSILGSIALIYIEFNLLFVVLGFLMIPGLFFTLLLKDTK